MMPMLKWIEFTQIAQEAFRFLVAEFDFRCISEMAPFLVYSNGKIQISIFFDVSRNGELDLGLERCEDVGKSKPFFRIAQIRKARGHAFPEPAVAPFLGNREDARRELNALAVQLRLHRGPVLKGDLSVRTDRATSRPVLANGRRARPPVRPFFSQVTADFPRDSSRGNPRPGSMKMLIADATNQFLQRNCSTLFFYFFPGLSVSLVDFTILARIAISSPLSFNNSSAFCLSISSESLNKRNQ